MNMEKNDQYPRGKVRIRERSSDGSFRSFDVECALKDVPKVVQGSRGGDRSRPLRINVRLVLSLLRHLLFFVFELWPM